MVMAVKKHYVLIHGICHGAWCWYRLSALLKRCGHQVTALDLAGCGRNPKRSEEISSMSDYVHPLMEFMKSLPPPEKVVLVGHSYAGLCISLAMESFPEKVAVGVFIAAYMPNSTDPPATLIREYFMKGSRAPLMDCQITFDRGLDNPPTSALLGPDYMANVVYEYCQTEDLELAQVLVRTNGFFVEDMAKESLLTEKRYGSVKRVYVVCEKDRVMEEEFQRYVIEKSPPEEVKFIPGAGHMVMLSKPHELSLCLQQLSVDY